MCWRKLNWEVSGFKLSFVLGAKVANSYKHVFGRYGINQRKIYNICERLAYKKKVVKSCVVFLKECMRSREWLNINDFRL